MEEFWKQDDKCPFCRDAFEIVQIKFGFGCVSLVSACPNCGLISISRTSADNKLWFLRGNVARAAKAFVLTLKR